MATLLKHKLNILTKPPFIREQDPHQELSGVKHNNKVQDRGDQGNGKNSEHVRICIIKVQSVTKLPQVETQYIQLGMINVHNKKNNNKRPKKIVPCCWPQTIVDLPPENISDIFFFSFSKLISISSDFVFPSYIWWSRKSFYKVLILI